MSFWTGEIQTGDLTAAISEFHAMLPGWWFSVGSCHVSADASCAPDSAGRDWHLLDFKKYDDGFHVDLHPPATMADALRQVMHMALRERQLAVTANMGEFGKDIK